MGVVYKARDLQLERLVAIKKLRADVLADEEIKARFWREARLAAQLNHPNIASIYDVIEDGGETLIVMEYVEGETLRDRIARGPRLPEEVRVLGMQLAMALVAAHKEGVIHRDIKTENVKITHEGTVKVVDFGLATKVHPVDAPNEEATPAESIWESQQGSGVGTPGYTAPEQWRGGLVDARADIFACGVVLYEMMTGKPPFPGSTAIDRISATLHADPPPITGLQDSLSCGLSQVVRKAIQKNPADRYQKMDDLLAALQVLSTEQETIRLQALKHESAVPSIAVLPFVNMSADPENEYFCDGLAEELINGLTKIKELRVVARTSAFSFKGKEADIREIGHKLNVKTVLEGSVRRAGNRLRIIAQLVDVADGYHLWTERYDRETGDVFVIQDEISLAIVDKLKVKLLREEKRALVKRYTDNPEAHSLYLKGRYFWNRRTEEGMKKAIEYFNQAIEKDPTYAIAYSGLADAYNILGYYFVSPKEVFPKAKAVAMKALEIDDSLAEAHTSLAFTKLFYDWDWLVAEREFKRALELNPGYVTGHHWYTEFLSLCGQHDEASAEAKRALELDPLSLIINTLVGWAFYYARRYDEAVEQLRRTLELDASFVPAHFWLGLAYEQASLFEEAIAAFQLAASRSETSAIMLAALGGAYAVSGRTGEARKVLEEFEQISKRVYVPCYYIAAIYAGLGEKDQAFEWLEKAHGERDNWLVFLKIDPLWDGLRLDPRFAVLLKRIGLDK